VYLIGAARLIELGKFLAAPKHNGKFSPIFRLRIPVGYSFVTGSHFAQFSRFLEAEKVAAVALMDGCLSLACLHRSKKWPFILFRTSLHFCPPDDLSGTSRQLIKCCPVAMTSPVSSAIDPSVPLVILTN
jgi:hypothetical protein